MSKYYLDTLCDKEPPMKKAKKNKPKIFDGRYYKITQEENGSILAECALCKEKKRGSESSTGNFINHYKTKHKEELITLKAYLKVQDEVKIKATKNQPKLNDFINQTENVRSYSTCLFI